MNETTTPEQLLALCQKVCAKGDETEIAEFFAQAEAWETAREARLNASAARRDAALWYAGNGIAVFPIIPRGKRPLFKSVHPEGDPARDTCKGTCGRDGHGLYDATTDLAKISKWWADNPHANIGLRTGLLFDVIDIDGPPGYASLLDLRAEGVIPDVLGVAGTPRGGQHLFIRPTGDGNSTGIWPGIDYRGDGGYVVAAPSVWENGRRYGWIDPIRVAELALQAAA
ncbi:bifunctional DNA primase/polymerase [Nonomuraea sediminis]|uniref:bifunctional DNA primase/polymerase n=1 Tax=Nonomuraea sediminis TaxID=2835864 RepID=UPI001BDBC14D|nr:bifunctional DNA primase/polymerase [Nonomuraea sediminis]